MVKTCRQLSSHFVKGKQPVAKGAKKTKDKIAKAALSSSKGKKKWGKSKRQEKTNNAVFISQEQKKTYMQEIYGMKLITIGIVSKRFRITGYLLNKFSLIFSLEA